MKKTIKYSILGLAALCTVVLCGGYYMLGHALKPEGLITRSRNIAESYNFMFEQYPELQPWVDSLVTVGALKDFYIENDHGETLHALIIRKTKCSGVSEQNVPFFKTKRTSVNLFPSSSTK